MTTKTLSTKDGTLDWADARAGDFVRLYDHRMEVQDFSPGSFGGMYATTADGIVHGLYAWRSRGAYLERDVEEHQRGLIPDEGGAVILTDYPDNEIYRRHQNEHLGGWRHDTYGDHHSDADVQRYADEHGFEVLWPRPAVEITDDMVKRGTEEICEKVFCDVSENLSDLDAATCEMQARAVLEAALGGGDDA